MKRIAAALFLVPAPFVVWLALPLFRRGDIRTAVGWLLVLMAAMFVVMGLHSWRESLEE